MIRSIALSEQNKSTWCIFYHWLHKARWTWSQVLFHWIHDHRLFQQKPARKTVHQVIQDQYEPQVISIIFEYSRVLGWTFICSIMTISNYCSSSPKTIFSSVLCFYRYHIHLSLFFNSSTGIISQTSKNVILYTRYKTLTLIRSRTKILISIGSYISISIIRLWKRIPNHMWSYIQVPVYVW